MIRISAICHVSAYMLPTFGRTVENSVMQSKQKTEMTAFFSLHSHVLASQRNSQQLESQEKCLMKFQWNSNQVKYFLTIRLYENQTNKNIGYVVKYNISPGWFLIRFFPRSAHQDDAVKSLTASISVQHNSKLGSLMLYQWPMCVSCFLHFEACFTSLSMSLPRLKRASPREILVTITLGDNLHVIKYRAMLLIQQYFTTVTQLKFPSFP